MNDLIHFDAQSIAIMTKLRDGERKMGQSVEFIADQNSFERCKSKYVLLGIPEDIGVRANGGRSGTHKAWDAFLNYFLSLPLPHDFNSNQLAILGTVHCHDLMEKSQNLNWQKISDQKRFDQLIKTLDQRVQSVIKKIICKGQIPIVIGGGHNNALPLIRGCAEALNYPINCLNIDAHADLRQDAYRHSGNGFYEAIRCGVLDLYGIFGLQKNTLSKSLTDFMHQNKTQVISLTLDQWLSTASQHKDAKLQSWCDDLIQKDFGLDVDMDVMADMGSSAQSPLGLSLMEVMSLITQLKRNPNLRYIHLCEGAPELGIYPAQVVKALGALILGIVD